MLSFAKRQNILGVDYTHLELNNIGDLYLTDYGVPLVEYLHPDNYWTDQKWYRSHICKLAGTSSVQKVTTKPVHQKSIDFVLKWNRMGQDIPGGMEETQLINAEFNSPFEEFSILMELRQCALESRQPLYTQKPLAIFSPQRKTDLFRMGRKEYRMQAIIEKHVEIKLDMHRPYAVLYEWVKGLDAVQAMQAGLIDQDGMEELTIQAHERMRGYGYTVEDGKPHHVIVRPRGSSEVLRNRSGNIVYAMIDHELLIRTPEREKQIIGSKRQKYLVKQRDRFKDDIRRQPSEHLERVNVMGVDYIYGPCETTGGALWVVGKDPELFDYFLPERWEQTSRTRLSSYNEIYHTLTKDSINLVWKVSKVGIQPDMDPFKPDERAILEFGYNSPFEEVAIALQLQKAGIATIYPRAVYMTGIKTEVPETLSDESRYASHAEYNQEKGKPLLRRDRDYILIWGYWNGPDEQLADEDGDYYRGVDALRALREGLISEETYVQLLLRKKERLLNVGFEDLNLRGSHLMLSILIQTGHLISGHGGLPEMRICNFELIRKVHADNID